MIANSGGGHTEQNAVYCAVNVWKIKQMGMFCFTYANTKMLVFFLPNLDNFWRNRSVALNDISGARSLPIINACYAYGEPLHETKYATELHFR